MKIIAMVILTFLFTLSNANATEVSFIANQSNDSLLSISNITKLYNYDVFTELNLLILEYKNSLESENFVEYNKHASKWNLMMRAAGNKTIIDLWTMPIKPETEKDELDKSGIYINDEYTAHMPLPYQPPRTIIVIAEPQKPPYLGDPVPIETL